MPLPSNADDELSNGMPPVVAVVAADKPMFMPPSECAPLPPEAPPTPTPTPTPAPLCVRGDVSSDCVAARLIFPDVIDEVSAVGMPFVVMDATAAAAAAAEA